MVSRYHQHRTCLSQLSQPFWSCMVRKCCFVALSAEAVEIQCCCCFLMFFDAGWIYRICMDIHHSKLHILLKLAWHEP